MSSHPELKVDWCSYEAAKYAVMNWHYSHSMPRSKMNTFGIWENNKFVGSIVFSYGATPQIGGPYNLTQYEICELTRVAFRNHEYPITRSLSRTISIFKKFSPNMRLIVSFADSEQEHLGIIYQAGNWIYTGVSKVERVGFIINGKKVHTRTIGLMPGGVQSLQWVQKYLDKKAREWKGQEKFRYLYPLDRKMRKQIEPLRKPYPKRATSIGSDVPAVQAGEGGANPTVALKVANKKL